MTREQIEAEIADLKAKNEAAPGWGAAVGARSERIKGLEQALRAMAPDQSSAASEGDISERLRKEAFEAVDWNGETMKQWDKIRALCAERDGSDLPRLMFESLIESLSELMIDGANEIDRLRQVMRDDAQPTPELQFCHWLKGYLGAIKGRDELTPHEANTIRGNLNELLYASQPSPAATVETVEAGPSNWRELEARPVAGPRLSAATEHALRAVLREHWITSVNCDKSDGTNYATCSCSAWRGHKWTSVRAAVDEWIDHVSGHLRAVPQPTREDIAQALCGADGNGFLCDCTPTAREAYMIRADAVLALTRPQSKCDGADDLEHLDGMLDDRERG